MEAFEKCVWGDHALVKADAMRTTSNLIRTQDVRLMDYSWPKVIKTTKEKCKHIFMSTWVRINGKNYLKMFGVVFKTVV